MSQPLALNPSIDQLAADIYRQGYAVVDGLVPQALLSELALAARSFSAAQYKAAGIGRQQSFTLAPAVRSDKLKWIEGDTELGRAWNDWLASLQQSLNSRLLLGLFSFESHFALYEVGDFYKRHRDAFVGESNRRLSVVLYLNEDWQPDQGGELVLYNEDDSHALVRVLPKMGRLVIFLSEDFPHEVLPTKRPRYSIAAWFRVNNSINLRIDPPL